MAAKPKAEPKLAIIREIKTTLAFFTLCILIIEALLISLAVRATAHDFTILIVGLLVGFLMLIRWCFDSPQGIHPPPQLLPASI